MNKEIVKVGSAYMRKTEVSHSDHKEEPVLDQWQTEIEKNNAQIESIRKNTNFPSVDQQLQAINVLEVSNKKLETERRKSLFYASIQQNRPQFEALAGWLKGAGIPPAFSTPESVLSLLNMRKEIEAKASQAKGAFDDVNIRLKEVQKYRSEIKTKWDEAEAKRKEAEDFQVRTGEKIKTVETEMIDCAKDMFEISPPYVVLNMPEIASILMGEAQVNSTPPATPIVQTSTNTSGIVGQAKQQSIGNTGVSIPMRLADSTKDNPQHKALIDAASIANIKKAVESGASQSSNKEVIAWLGKYICGFTEIITDHSLESKVSLRRDALGYQKG